MTVVKPRHQMPSSLKRASTTLLFCVVRCRVECWCGVSGKLDVDVTVRVGDGDRRGCNPQCAPFVELQRGSIVYS